jgi:hypothetical protein
MKKLTLIAGAFFCLASLSVFAQTPSPAPVSSVSGNVKPSDINQFDYIITGLSTTTEANDLLAIIKARPLIVDAFADITTHVVTIYSPLTMPESDLLEILKFAGKTVISDPKEITKFY